MISRSPASQVRYLLRRQAGLDEKYRHEVVSELACEQEKSHQVVLRRVGYWNPESAGVMEVLQANNSVLVTWACIAQKLVFT